MAPVVPPVRSDKDKHIKAVLSFAVELQEQLPAAVASKTPGTLLNGVEKYISAFPNKLGAAGASNVEDFDSHGTVLWNMSTRLRRNYESTNAQAIPIILIVTRVFAFLLLACAHEYGNGLITNVVRLMKIGLKTTKNCLDMEQLDLALKVLEKVASYEGVLKEAGSSHGQPDVGSEESYGGLSAEYYILRMALAWRQNDTSLADHMFQKSTSFGSVDPHSAENLADVLYEMGSEFLGKKDYTMAAKWLERAYGVLTSHDLERMSIDASELRTSIINVWVKALLELRDQGGVGKAHGLIDMLHDEVGDKLLVLLLRLEAISASSESFDSNSYYDILHRMTRTVVLTDANLKLIITHIRKLNDKIPGLASTAVDELFRLRILKSGRVDWIEKLLIIRILMATSQQDGPDALVSLEQILASIGENLRQPISSPGTHAAHTLLWTRIESNYAVGQYEVAERWCHLAMHQVFEKSGEINMARIARKLLLCTLARKDLNNARELFGSMPDAAKNEPMTRFLMYKIAIRCREIEFATECLDLISKSSGKDSTLLFACVLDAKQVGDKRQALEGLQRLHEKYDYGAPPGIHLPSLFRITIGLTASILKGSNGTETYDRESTAEKLCNLFEGATASLSQKHPQSQTSEVLWSIHELEWFSKNSYNFAVKYINSWNPRHSVRILLCCISFIDAYPRDISEQVAEDLALRKMLCEFSVSIALTSLARGEDVVENQLQMYMALRKHVESFDSELQEKVEKLEAGPAQDLLQKLAVLITFDFEAACQLKAWDSFGEIILKAEVCKSMKVYEVMADCILSVQAPPQVLITTLKKVVNEAWGLEELDTLKLSKYMRCLFQISISDNLDIAEQLLDQVQANAKDAAETDQPYPMEELEWMATRAFNRAVDLYCGREDEACKRWSEKALGIAHCCDDDGALEKLLQSRLLKLSWDN